MGRERQGGKGREENVREGEEMGEDGEECVSSLILLLPLLLFIVFRRFLLVLRLFTFLTSPPQFIVVRFYAPVLESIRRRVKQTDRAAVRFCRMRRLATGAQPPGIKT